MAQLSLVIGNRNYSSWSLRPWLLLRHAAIPFEEIQLQFYERADGHVGVTGIERYSPTGKVPLLMVDGEPVWDSLAICETLAELHPEKALWPADPRARRTARAITAEMHSGFQALRSAMPMNIRGSFPGEGDTPAVQRDIARIIAIWSACREQHGAAGPMLFGRFSVADAFYAPVVMRFFTYAVALPAECVAYAEAVRALPAMREWMDAAQRETAFLAAEEPYVLQQVSQQVLQQLSQQPGSGPQPESAAGQVNSPAPR